MEILSFDGSAARSVTAHGSVDFTVQALIRSDAVAVTVLRVAAGGLIGRHPAVGDQLFLVTAGAGSVQGGNGEWVDVAAGQGVLWRSGEEHTTRAAQDLTAVVVEMPSMAV
jgi:quercetin dioxygenase-like cupin family protein